MTDMVPWKFKCPPCLAMANNIADEIGKYARKLNITKALLVTDKVIVKLGLAERLLKAGEADGISFAVYDEVLPEPPVDNPYAAYAIYKEQGCNGVVGLGGGSALDVAKAVAMLATNPGKFEDYLGIDKVPNRCAPLILMPTTSGTGSETSSFSLMLVNGSKAGVVDQKIMADVALVDPVLTLSAPRSVTASTGLDAFAHHYDCLFSVNQSRLLDSLCLDGISVIAKYLRKAWADGGNLEARYWMSYASTLGGVVMNMNDGASANHGLAFALVAKHVSHGLANAVLLKHTLPVLGKAEHEKVVLMGKVMGENMDGLSGREALQVVTDAVASLVGDVGCDIPLGDFDITEKDLDFLVKEAAGQGRVMGHATYRMTEEEIRGVFANAL